MRRKINRVKISDIFFLIFLLIIQFAFTGNTYGSEYEPVLKWLDSGMARGILTLDYEKECLVDEEGGLPAAGDKVLCRLRKFSGFALAIWRMPVEGAVNINDKIDSIDGPSGIGRELAMLKALKGANVYIIPFHDKRIFRVSCPGIDDRGKRCNAYLRVWMDNSLELNQDELELFYSAKKEGYFKMLSETRKALPALSLENDPFFRIFNFSDSKKLKFAVSLNLLINFWEKKHMITGFNGYLNLDNGAFYISDPGDFLKIKRDFSQEIEASKNILKALKYLYELINRDQVFNYKDPGDLNK